MICDVHAHCTPKNFSEFMGDRFAAARSRDGIVTVTGWWIPGSART
jgi:hypothetical protein